MLTGASRAQTPKAPAITSPQVLPDRQVAFRVYSPNAREVQVVGDWLRRGESPTAMEKGADGVWSVTVGPLPPGVYGYTFLKAIIPGSYGDRFLPKSCHYCFGAKLNDWRTKCFKTCATAREC